VSANVGTYAAGTSVSPEKSRWEIESVLKRYGAEGFAYASEARRARIEFIAKRRRVRFDVTFPDPKDKRFTHEARRSWMRRSETAAIAAWDAEVRRLWRALLLAIKAKLEVVQSGMAIFEEEFLANIVMPDGRTVGEHVAPKIAQAYETGRAIALLPAAGDDVVDV
jgi:hypothetical protein